jgi:hypothetical protein
MANLQNTGTMTSRERFQQTINYGTPDRVPRFEEGIREEVIEAWRSQGLPKDKTLSQVFSYDSRREIIFDSEPLPKLRKLPTSKSELDTFRRSLDAADPSRLS